ncbi:ATP-binding protein [Paenibacillus sp. sgz500992]|uniref:ATP-binding protein n=1 Tax=Paenibacillus sp. sgz500992 TaxID=3242476 RepID=UPI0036D2BBB9
MNTMLREELLYLITFPLIPVILHYFFSRSFTCRIKSNPYLVLIYALYMACHLALHHSQLPDMVLLTANTGLIFLLSLLYRGDNLWRGYSAFFVTALIFLGEAVMPFAYTDSGYIANLFLSKLLVLSLVYLLLRITKGEGRGNLAGWYWSLLLVCPVLSVITLVSLSDNFFFQAYPKLFPVVPTMLLAINCLIFVLSDHILCVQSERSKRLLLEQQNTYYVNQYLMTRDKQEEAFKFQHDFKNILLGLRAGLAKDEETSVHELDRLLGTIGQPAGSCDTGNPVIDAMISYKEQTAGSYDTPFRLELNIPPQLELDTTVISVILGNTLDNAIEACRETFNQERYVLIHMHYLNDSLFIKIQNPYAHEISTNRYGEISSTKADTRSHGIGLRNIRKTVEEWGGLLDISYNSGLFQVEVVLFHIPRKLAASG